MNIHFFINISQNGKTKTKKWLHESIIILLFLATTMIRSTSYHQLNRKSADSKKDERLISSKLNSTVKGRKKDVIEKYLESEHTVLSASLTQLRHTILCEQLPNPCPYRSYVWSTLLRAAPVESEWYSGVVSRGPSDVNEKIKNDVFRTFQNNNNFWNNVNEDAFVRVLNAYAWCVDDDSVGYVQGMNVLAAPIMYVAKSEPQAFSLIYRLFNTHLSRYVTKNLSGARDGVKLVEIVLKCVDVKLYNVLKQRIASADMYALPSVLTLSACTPSLDEVIKLWDFLFSFGVHLNIMAVVAQLCLMRDEIIASKNPMNILRQFKEVNAEKIIKLTLSITKIISDDLYELIVRHTYDDDVSRLIDHYYVQ